MSEHDGLSNQATMKLLSYRINDDSFSELRVGTW